MQQAVAVVALEEDPIRLVHPPAVQAMLSSQAWAMAATRSRQQLATIKVASIMDNSNSNRRRAMGQQAPGRASMWKPVARSIPICE